MNLPSAISILASTLLVKPATIVILDLSSTAVLWRGTVSIIPGTCLLRRSTSHANKVFYSLGSLKVGDSQSNVKIDILWMS